MLDSNIQCTVPARVHGHKNRLATAASDLRYFLVQQTNDKEANIATSILVAIEQCQHHAYDLRVDLAYRRMRRWVQGVRMHVVEKDLRILAVKRFVKFLPEPSPAVRRVLL